MERKGGSTTLAVEAEEVRRALPLARTVSSEEEKTLRMRYGAGADLKAPLPKAAGTNVALADELLLMEMQLLRAFKARSPHGTALPAPPVARASVVRNPAKDKIVRALRKKK